MVVSSYCVASEAIDLVIFIRTVQPWPPEPKNDEATEVQT